MELDAFLHDLHFNIDHVRPPTLAVDWEEAPLPYKLYRGLPAFPLSFEVPLELAGAQPPSIPDINKIGHFLWYTFGIGQLNQSPLPAPEANQATSVTQMYRRFAPAGGGLYPNELYVYLKIEPLPIGVYHYDVAHHRLILLREGNFDSYLGRAAGCRREISDCFGAVFVSTVFRKNFFKYNSFSYRLQGLDTGVLMGQLLEAARRFGFSSRVHFQFIDRGINHLLGLAEKEESVYSIISLAMKPTILSDVNSESGEENIDAGALCLELTSLSHQTYTRSQKPLEYPMLNRMNEAAMLDSLKSVWRIEEKETEKRIDSGHVSISLPCSKPLTYDLASICCKRSSPGTDFVLKKISQVQIACLLKEAMTSFSYLNDLDTPNDTGSSPRTSLYGCLYGVEGIPDGSYQYDHIAHALRTIGTGDYRMKLQQGMAMHNVNLFQVPICLHIAGRRDYLVSTLGYRGYRISQMEAGMLVQRVLLVASAIGIGGHAILGFDVQTTDDIYHMMDDDKTSLIQIPVGPYRSRPKLEGSLHG